MCLSGHAHGTHLVITNIDASPSNDISCIVPRQPSGYDDSHTTNTIRYNEAAADCTNVTGHRPKKSMVC